MSRYRREKETCTRNWKRLLAIYEKEYHW